MTFSKFLAGAALSAAALSCNTAAAQPAPTAVPVAVPAATLLSYAGTYTTDRGMEAKIALQLDGTLTVQLNSEPLSMRPLSTTEFAVDEKRSRITFDTNGGKVRGFTVRQGSRELYTTRVD